MARVVLIDPDKQEDLSEAAARMRQGRRGNLLNLYKALFHNPDLADSWFQHMNAVRWKTSLDGRLREIIIVRIANLNKSAYAMKQHVPKLAEADGLSEAECHELADWRISKSFSGRERAALAYADAMTLECQVADDIFADIRSHFEEQGIVDLTILIATYNMHTRVTNALALDLEQD